MRSRVAGYLSVCSVLAASLSWTVSGRAEGEPKKRCSAAYEDAQRLRRQGHLVEAARQLVFCGGPECPVMMQADCERWLTAVEASMPTVVFQVTDAKGSALRKARIAVDGGDWSVLDGRALSIDPGEHQIEFTADARQTLTRSYLFSEGEKLRHETVALLPIREKQRALVGTPRRPLKVDTHTSGTRLTLPLVLAGSAGALGGIGLAYFGLTARAKERELDTCAPSCAQDRVDRVRRDYLWANVSLGVGVSGVVAAAILVILQHRTPRAAQTATIGVGMCPAALGPALSGNFGAIP